MYLLDAVFVDAPESRVEAEHLGPGQQLVERVELGTVSDALTHQPGVLRDPAGIHEAWVCGDCVWYERCARVCVWCERYVWNRALYPTL